MRAQGRHYRPRMRRRLRLRRGRRGRKHSKGHRRGPAGNQGARGRAAQTTKPGGDKSVCSSPEDTTVVGHHITARRHREHKNTPGRGKTAGSRAEDTTTTRPGGTTTARGARSPGRGRVRLNGIGGAGPPGGGAPLLGRGQSSRTTLHGGSKTKSGRGHRSSKEGGTTTQGVPAPGGPSSGVGLRGRREPARNTRSAKGFSWTTIPRGGSQARRGFPGRVIADPGTADHLSTLRE